MARKLSKFDWTKSSLLTTTDKATYDWDRWFDGDIWELSHGEDFYGHPLMMERIIRTRATSKHVTIRLRHVGVNGEPWGKLVVECTSVIGPDQRKKAAANKEAEKAERAAKRAAKKAAADTPAVNGATTNGAKVPVAKKVVKRPAKVMA